MFGSLNQPATSAAPSQPAAGGAFSFGAKPATSNAQAPGTSAPSTGGGLFGGGSLFGGNANAQQQNQQPGAAAGGGLFGQSTSGAAGGSGLAGSLFGGQQAQPQQQQQQSFQQQQLQQSQQGSLAQSLAHGPGAGADPKKIGQPLNAKLEGVYKAWNTDNIASCKFLVSVLRQQLDCPVLMHASFSTISTTMWERRQSLRRLGMRTLGEDRMRWAGSTT